MLKDIPYNVLKQDEQAYEIMLLRDQYDYTYSAIAKEFETSVGRVIQIYHKLKAKQIQLYMNHISVVLGYEDCSPIRKVVKQASECYQERMYVCAYLEKRYKDILTAYRNGEPGMPQPFLKSVPPLKPELSKKAVARIIEMRETEKATFAEIAKELHITRQKAKHTYDCYYHAKALEHMGILLAKAESEQDKKEIWDYYFGNNYSPKRRYEMLAKNNLCHTTDP